MERDIKKFVFLNEFFDRFNLIRATPVEVDIFDTDKYINEYVKVIINNKLIKQLGFTDVPERSFSAIKKMSKETRMAVPNKLRCPEMRVFITENMIHKIAAEIVANYNEIEKETIKEQYPATQMYKPMITYKFDDFDKQRNKLLTKFANVVNIVVKRTFAELKRRAPKDIDDAMKQIDEIINTFKNTENDGDKKNQFNVTKDVFTKLQQTYKAIINYKKINSEPKADSIGSFAATVAKEVKAMNVTISNIGVWHYISKYLSNIMQDELTVYAHIIMKEPEVPEISSMIDVTIDAHDKPIKPAKPAKSSKKNSKKVEDEEEIIEPAEPIDEQEPEQEQEHPTDEEEEEIIEKPKKVIKKKAHKK